MDKLRLSATLAVAMLGGVTVPALAAPCTPGSFSPTGSDPCVPAPPGTYVPTVGASTATRAPVGTFVSTSGASTPTLAPVGTFVSSTGASTATQAPVGTFVSTSGASTPTLAPVGTFVSSTGASTATRAPVGTFVSTSGASTPTLAPAGTFVSSTGASTATETPAGSFAANAGQSTPTLAAPGFYVSTTGATSETPAPVGTFVMGFGQTAATSAPAGFFASMVGSTAASACAVGGASYGGAEYCRALASGLPALSGPGLTISPGIIFDFNSVVVGNSASTVFTLANLPSLLSKGLGIDDLTIFSIIAGGPFSANGIASGTVLDGGQSAMFMTQFSPTAVGSYVQTLSVSTDQFANFGQAGQEFTITLRGVGIAVPEPKTWALLLAGFGFSGLMLRRSRRKQLRANAPA
jgi:hypothetical protein